MNEDISQIVKGRLVGKNELLKNPQKYRNIPMVCLEVGPEYVQALVLFATELSIDSEHNRPLEVTLRAWPEDITKRATAFFFTLRDRLAKAMGDESRDHKNHLYRSCVAEYTGGKKKSVKELDKREMWQCTELMFKWCYENGAYLGDLLKEKEEIRKEYNNG